MVKPVKTTTGKIYLTNKTSYTVILQLSLALFPVLHYLDAAKEIVVPHISKITSENTVVLINGTFNFQIQLRKNNYVFSEGPVYSNQCFYNGNVNDEPRFYAAFDVCDGLNGMFIYKDKTFYLTPRNNRSLGEHILEQIKSNSNSSSQCFRMLEPVNFKKHSVLQKARIRREANQYSEIKFLELFLVNDYSVFKYYNSNISEVMRRSNLIANILDAKYSVIEVRIILVGIEVWDKGNKIEVVESSQQTILSFMDYRKNFIRVRNDNAQLITKNPFDGGLTAGKAPVGTICSDKYSVGISHDSNDNPAYIANVVAHELGHSLGMLHDEHAQCLCYDNDQNGCIMGQYLDGNVKSFSECSVQYFKDFLSSGHGGCLYDYPVGRPRPSICGNGIIEPGEECDCGSNEKCIFYGNCCRPVTCTLYRNATCASGECCQQCQFKARGVGCREQREECDLAEYCDGVSGMCPKDIYVQNTHSCGGGKGFCHQGICLTHKHQCIDMFGANTLSADAYCYKELNTKGSYGGHCGMKSSKFKPCKETDAFCGKLHCDKTIRNDLLDNRLVWSELNVTKECKSVKYNDTNISNDQLGIVKDGTRCGSKSICINYTCTDLLTYQLIHNITKCPQNCSQQGVCNSNGNCHCDPGWKPPYCDRPGEGGSIDSGPPPIQLCTLFRANILETSFYIYLTPGLILLILSMITVSRSRKISKQKAQEKESEKERLLS